MNPRRRGITILADAHFIPLRDKAISKTLSKSVLEHVKNPFKVILEMKRVTADKIFIMVPNIVSFKRIWANLKNPLRKVNSGTKHLQGWDIKLIGHIANATGLKVIAVEWPLRKTRRWSFMFKSLFAGSMTVILKDVGELCRKCGTPKRRLWCDPEFTYCPKCDVDGPECTRAMA